MLIADDTLVSPYTHIHTLPVRSECLSADLKLRGKGTVHHHRKMRLTWSRSVLLRKRKNLPFPEKRRMMSTYVDFQAVSNVPPLCLPIRPWDRVTAG